MSIRRFEILEELIGLHQIYRHVKEEVDSTSIFKRFLESLFPQTFWQKSKHLLNFSRKNGLVLSKKQVSR